MIRQPLLTVDLAAVAENWRRLDALSGEAECGAVCKADAYGLGAERVAPALLAAGARSFFVATLDEGLQLRRALGDGPTVYILNGASGDGIEEAAAAGLLPVLSAPEQVEDACARSGDAPLACALHADTGMNRLGLAETYLKRLEEQDAHRRLDVRLLVSHLGCADNPDNPANARQADRFDAVWARMRRLFPDARPSLAATAGLLLGGRYLQRMTRPGIGLYGGLPFAEARRTVRLEAPVLQVREIAEGESVGYGGDWTAPRPSRIATLAIGYADGVLRSFAAAGFAWIGERRAPLAGRVNMDLVTLDVTDVPEARAGAAAELLGPRQSIDEMARAAGTIGHEILAALHGRCKRRYLAVDGSGEEAP